MVSVPVLVFAPPLADSSGPDASNIRSLNAELLERASRNDYPEWLNGTLAAAGCVRPIRLRGTIRDLDASTGEVFHTLDTRDTPDGVIYLPCGDRRASVCPPCAETYRADTYQLIRAGLAGDKGLPESVATHPCVFATFTAPSFGSVHTRVELPGGKIARCRPRRKASYCPHGRRLSCGQRHKDTDACLGRPLCPNCYDYTGAVVWNAHAPQLWRRTIITLRRQLAKVARKHGVRVKLSYARVAEFQRRGLIHFHAIFRLDGIDPIHPERTVPPHPALNAELLADLIRQVADTVWFATVSHPMKPTGWDITWGDQVQPRVVKLTGDGQITDTAVASYLAKYATKSTEPVGVPPGRITAENAPAYADPRTHQGRLIAACLRVGKYPHQDFAALRRWAYMLGYRGHFATRAAATPPPCALSAPDAGTGTAASIPTTASTRTKPSSPRPSWNGLGGAGAAAATPSWLCPPLHAPVSTGALPARNPRLPDTARKEAMAMEKLLYRPKEAAQLLGVGRATIYDLMHAGKIRSVKDGGKRFITLDALHEYIRQLEDRVGEVA